MQRLLGLVRRCADDYNMISENDKIAVGVSGGKDSLALLLLLCELRRFYPKKFELCAITLDMGLAGMDFSGVSSFCERLGVPYTIIKTEIAKIVFETRREKNPCAMCSKMRRGALNEAILSQGITKIALGHHYDDAVETFFMCLLYEGRLGCFQPTTFLDRTGVTQIRPLLYISEESIRRFAQRVSLPVVPSTCPMDKDSKRQEVKTLIETLSETYPDLKSKVFGAMQRLPLAQWQPESVARRPLPDVEI